MVPKAYRQPRARVLFCVGFWVICVGNGSVRMPNVSVCIGIEGNNTDTHGKYVGNVSVFVSLTGLSELYRHFIGGSSEVLIWLRQNDPIFRSPLADALSTCTGISRIAWLRTLSLCLQGLPSEIFIASYPKSGVLATSKLAIHPHTCFKKSKSRPK